MTNDTAIWVVKDVREGGPRFCSPIFPGRGLYGVFTRPCVYSGIRNYYLSLFFWGGGGSAKAPQWARVSSIARFLDHTQRRTTVGRTPLYEWSACRRDLYLTTHNIHYIERQTCRRWDSNPRSQQARGRRPRPKGAHTRTSLASESGWARVPMSQTRPCVECNEPDLTDSGLARQGLRWRSARRRLAIGSYVCGRSQARLAYPHGHKQRQREFCH
jgi:hypothetical protein